MVMVAAAVVVAAAAVVLSRTYSYDTSPSLIPDAFGLTCLLINVDTHTDRREA